jgi:hypothetical protein
VAATLPLATQIRVALEVPGHVVVQVTLGLVPVFLVDAINDVGTGWGAWREQDARVASTLLSDATWLEVGAALRPAGTPGLEIGLSYVLLWTHRVAEGLVGEGMREVALDLHVQALHGEVAWQTVVAGPLYFRLAVGWIHAVSHGLTLVAASDEARTAAARIGASLSAEVGARAFGPTLTVAVGFRL